jgi:adenylyl cyclase-associated protein
VEWVKSFQSFLTDLSVYVKEYHTTGLAWNPRGGDAPLCSTAPPPPPAPSVAQLEAFSGSTPSAKPAENFNAVLLGELSKGASGLKKVEKSQMTHKNPELRATSVVKAGDIPASKTIKQTTRGPAKCVLEGNKWAVVNIFANSRKINMITLKSLLIKQKSDT